MDQYIDDNFLAFLDLVSILSITLGRPQQGTDGAWWITSSSVGLLPDT